MKQVPIEDRFWQYVDKKGPDECWPWRGTVGKKSGRGQIKKNRRHAYAYRVSWELENGRDIPPDQSARHTCDNPICVNPKHVVLGTQADNIRDCISKGRRVKRGKDLVKRKPGSGRRSLKKRDGET